MDLFKKIYPKDQQLSESLSAKLSPWSCCQESLKGILNFVSKKLNGVKRKGENKQIYGKTLIIAFLTCPKGLIVLN